MTGFCTSPDFVPHDTGPHHPERPDRLRAIFQAVRAAGLITSANPLPDVAVDLHGLPTTAAAPLVELAPRPAEEQWIEAVHPSPYLRHVQEVCRVGGVLDGGDTPVSPASFDVALLAAGAVLTCCDQVVGGRVRRAFAAVRPPGHHAEPAAAMGFCLLANVAIAARYLQRKHGVGKIAIVDFDVHHGNGTQAAFGSDGSVLFISLHQHPATCYPGTGYETEIGEGAGRGCIVNIPMPPGSGDSEYLRAMDGRVLPRIDQFKPEFLLLSAGFDAHRLDPLAAIELSEDGFAGITRRLVEAADGHCGGRVVSALEGGYHLGALARSVVAHLTELSRA